MTNHGLRELYIDELKDLLDAENRLIKTLPKLAKASNSEELRTGFEQHLQQTREHVDRLRQILTELGEKPVGKRCDGIAGIIQEGDKLLSEGYVGALKDAALISAAQRVEHYEIAAYGCVRSWANQLGEDAAVTLLSSTLAEEKEADRKLTELSVNINRAAGSGTSKKGEEELFDQDESPKRARAARA
jgi:ferritin-like metal-binding protein YciE